jgi:hypothetical protein
MSMNVREMSFLGAGPGLTVALPDDFEEVPELETPFLNGIGGRSFIFVPERRVESLDGEDVFVRVVRDRDGREVSLSARKAPPPIWHLHWKLTRGSLYTHLREEDTENMAEPTAASIAILEEEVTGLPIVLAYSPLEYGVSDFAGYEERILFFSLTQPEDSVAFVRPAELEAGQRIRADEGLFGAQSVMRVGLGSGIEAQVSLTASAADVQAVAGTIQKSFEVL